MNKCVFVLLCFIFLSSCSEEANIYDDGQGKAAICPLVLAIPTVNILIDSLDPLPPNLMVAVGGDNPDLDECSPEDDLPFGAIHLNSYRTTGNLYVPFWPGSEDYTEYFPNFGVPVKNDLRVRIYSRASCGDAPVLRYEMNDVPVQWTPIFAMNPQCGASGFFGAAEVRVE